MPGPLIAGIAGSVGSAALQSRAAKKAGQAQTAAANDQISESRRQFDVIKGLLNPYVKAGTGALQGQLDLMGIGGGGGTAPTIEEYTISAGSPQTVWINGGSGGRYNKTVQGSPTTGYRVNGQTFTTREEAQVYADANKTGGISAADAQRNAIGALEGGEQFGALVRQGEYGLNANAAATGGLRGGNNQAALAQFRPQMLQSLIDRQLANLGGIAANGQSAAANLGSAAQNTGAQVNAALGDRGAALAGSALASGKAWVNAGAGILNTVGSLAQPTTPGGGAWQKWSF